MKSYHFNCGNSNTGPVGLCAEVRADSRKEAAEILNDFIEDAGSEKCIGGVDLRFDRKGVEYLNVYLGSVKPRHIDSVDEEAK